MNKKKFALSFMDSFTLQVMFTNLIKAGYVFEDFVEKAKELWEEREKHADRNRRNSEE